MVIVSNEILPIGKVVYRTYCAPDGVTRTKNQPFLIIGIGEEKQWREECKLEGMSEPIRLPGYNYFYEVQTD